MRIMAIFEELSSLQTQFAHAVTNNNWEQVKAVSQAQPPLIGELAGLTGQLYGGLIELQKAHAKCLPVATEPAVSEETLENPGEPGSTETEKEDTAAQ